MNDLDVVAIGVENKGGIVAGVIRALAGSTVVLATCSDRRRVKAIDRRPIGRLKGKMDPAGQLAAGSAGLRRRNEELIAPEEVRAFDEGNAQHTQHGLIEAPA